MIITQYVTIRNIISTKIDKKIRPRLSLYHFFYFGSVKLPSMRGNVLVRHFLSGVTLTAAALIAMTAITQIMALPADPAVYGVAAVSALLLLSKKIPAPLIVAAAATAGFLM